MKVGYLILAHNQPNHFHNLVNVLLKDYNELIIHIDLKSDIELFKNSNLLGKTNIHFIDDRIDVKWGKFSVVEATIRLIKTAISKVPFCDYYCLISGSDFPVISPGKIQQFFMANNGFEFMDLNYIPKFTSRQSAVYLNNADQWKFYVTERMSIYELNEVPIKIPPPVYNILSKFIRKLKIRRNHRKIMPNMEVYAGSQWWALSRSALFYINDYIEDCPNFVKYFNNTLVPDEMFFHLIIGNSIFRTNVKGSVTFTKWEELNSHPETIDDAILTLLISELKETKKIESLKYLFARKFPDNSDKLIAKLDIFWT